MRDLFYVSSSVPVWIPKSNALVVRNGKMMERLLSTINNPIQKPRISQKRGGGG